MVAPTCGESQQLLIFFSRDRRDLLYAMNAPLVGIAPPLEAVGS